MSCFWCDQHGTSDCQVRSILGHLQQSLLPQGKATPIFVILESMFRLFNVFYSFFCFVHLFWWCWRKKKTSIINPNRKYDPESQYIASLDYQMTSNPCLWLGAGSYKGALQHAKSGHGGQQHKESRRASIACDESVSCPSIIPIICVDSSI